MSLQFDWLIDVKVKFCYRKGTRFISRPKPYKCIHTLNSSTMYFFWRGGGWSMVLSFVPFSGLIGKTIQHGAFWIKRLHW